MVPLQQFLNQVWKGFNTLPSSKKISLLAIAAATLIGIGILVYMVHQTDYRVLFSNLSNEDAGHIVAKLQEKKIPYRLSSTGDSILVPAAKVSELRLELASSGLPQGGGIGFEIFDTKNLGLTEFVQQLNYQRALQGELTRTINGLDEVQGSRVHIVIPKKSLFIEDQKKPTASVFLKLKPGRSLRSGQIDGIAHLVASSIEGLKPGDVMIVDNSGKVLSKVQSESRIAGLSIAQTEYQRNIEKDLTARVQSMLEKVVGEGKAVVRVTADLDFRVTERTEEKYDPEEPVIRSVQRQGGRSDDSEGREGSSSRRTDEVINYEINRTVNKTVMPVGDVRKLSIAVLVDGNYAKNDKGAEEFQPRSKKELADLEELVKKAVGFDAKREDQVVVTNVPFKKVDPEGLVDGESWKDRIAAFLPLFKYLTFAAGIICLILFVLRPMVRLLIAKGQEHPAGAQLPDSPEALLEGKSPPLALADISVKSMTEADIVRQMAGADAQKFAELLRNWLK